MREFRGKRVVILGLARQGTALAGYLARQGARVLISDLQPAEKLAPALQALQGLPIEYALGGHPESLLEGAELLCLSGGVPAEAPIARAARARGIPLSNDAQIFLEACPARTIGITGSAGKSTTTALVALMLKAGAQTRQVWVGGNIGNPLIEEVERMDPRDQVVMELSSFQLELMTKSPNVAAVLNLTPNHLDRHGTMQAYAVAKGRILDYQDSEDWAVLGLDDPGARGLRNRAKGRLAFFSALEAPEQGAFLREDEVMLRFAGTEEAALAVGEIGLRGRHNLYNVLAASAIAGCVGAPREAMRSGLRGFSGLPHRLEFVREVNGARWYNDSIATAPERTCAAIRAFEEPLVVLAGGRDKALPWDEFAQLALGRVRDLVVFGEARDLIARAVGNPPAAEGPGQSLRSVTHAEGLEGAVSAASKLARPGDVVLLAPGGTSFDQFKDFEERGERFKELVRAL